MDKLADMVPTNSLNLRISEIPHHSMLEDPKIYDSSNVLLIRSKNVYRDCEGNHISSLVKYFIFQNTALGYITVASSRQREKQDSSGFHNLS